MMKNNTYKWISVEDELPPRDPDYPEESIGVIVYNPTQKHPIYEDWYIFADEDPEWIGWYQEKGVTHWCYLPKSPK